MPLQIGNLKVTENFRLESDRQCEPITVLEGHSELVQSGVNSYLRKTVLQHIYHAVFSDINISPDTERQLNLDAVSERKTSANVQSKLSADATVFEPKQQSEAQSEVVFPVDGISANHTDETAPVDNASAAADGNAADENDSEAGDEDSEDDDDILVTIGDIKTTYDGANKYKPPYQRSLSQVAAGSGTKPAGKGVDMDAVGNINGVPVYEFDLDGLKVEDKPWRKPGADITDYFNYGFNEDTWTKYCEKQRRLRIENNANKSGGNLIFVQGAAGPVHRSERSQPLDIPAHNNVSFDHQRAAGLPLSMQKPSGTIDVIGASVRDTRRQPLEFRESEQKPDLPPRQPIAPVTNIISVPVPISVALPPHLNVPPPDFALPPPGALPPPPGTLHPPPPHIGPPPGLIAPPLVVGPPPPGFAAPPPQVVRVPVDPFGRLLGPPPPERRPPPNFVERPPFSFDQFGRPIFAPPASGPPPGWEQRPGGGGVASGPINVVVSGGAVASSGGSHSQRLSPLRSDTEFSSSDDDVDQKAHIKTEPLDKEWEREEYRRRDRSRSDEIRRSKDSDRRDYDRDRDRGRSGRDSDRDRRDRSRDRDRGDKRRERDDRHSKRKEDDSRHRSKHKKTKKVKEEPEDTEDNAIPTIKSER